MLYQRVVEIDERVTLEDYAEDPERSNTPVNGEADLVKGLSGETIRILRRPDEQEVRRQLQVLYDAGFRSVAVCLLHSYTYPDHEDLVGGKDHVLQSGDRLDAFNCETSVLEGAAHHLPLIPRPHRIHLMQAPHVWVLDLADLKVGGWAE